MKKENIHIYHPFLFALFPGMFLWAHNPNNLLVLEVLGPLVVIGLATTALFFLVNLFFRNPFKTAILVSLFVIIFFAHGHVFRQIYGWQLGPFIMSRHRYLMTGWALLFTVVFFWVLITRRDLKNFTLFLNRMSMALILISALLIGMNVVSQKISSTGRARHKVDMGSLPALNPSQGPQRDVYFIILDGYASTKVLEDVFQFNNQEFINFLKQKGFYVASKSHSNYSTTEVSLPSFLNMDYLTEFSKKVGENCKNLRATYAMIENNKVMNLFKSLGYQFIHFSSGAMSTSHNRYADKEYSYGKRINEFQMNLIQTSLLAPWEKSIIGDDARGRILFTFDELGQIPKINAPKFVFAHILCPHPPYVFGQNGQEVEDAELTMSGNIWKRRDLYVDQVVFTNTKVKALVEGILAHSKIPPIIILQADHGPTSSFDRLDVEGWRHPTSAMLKENMSIFNAYYLPGGGNKLLYDSITPVNTFRVVFNHYYGAKFPLLKDRVFYSTEEYPYKFTDVTDIVMTEK